MVKKKPIVEQKLPEFLLNKDCIRLLIVDPSYTNFGIIELDFFPNKDKFVLIRNETIKSDKNKFFCGKKINLKDNKIAKANFDNFRLNRCFDSILHSSKVCDIIITENQPHKNVNEVKTIVQLVAGLKNTGGNINDTNCYFEQIFPIVWKKLAFGKYNADKKEVQHFVRNFFKQKLDNKSYVSWFQQNKFDEHQFDALGMFIAIYNKYFNN